MKSPLGNEIGVGLSNTFEETAVDSFDVLILFGDQLVDGNRTALGEDEFQQQLTAQFPQMGNRIRHPGAKRCASRSCRRVDRLGTTSPTWLFSAGFDELALEELIDRSIREGSRQRPDASDVPSWRQDSGESKAVVRRLVQQPQACPLPREEIGARSTAPSQDEPNSWAM